MLLGWGFCEEFSEIVVYDSREHGREVIGILDGSWAWWDKGGIKFRGSTGSTGRKW